MTKAAREYTIYVDPADDAKVKEVNVLLKMFDVPAEASYCMYWEGTVGGKSYLLPFHIKFHESEKGPYGLTRPSLHFASPRKLMNATKRLIEAMNLARD